MDIDVFDMDDPVLGTARRTVVRAAGSTIIELYGMSNGIEQMVSEIRRRAPLGSIRVLRIWGHGWSGGQMIAAGAHAQTGVDHGSALWASNLRQFGPVLQRLRPYFQGGARVELKGCQVASGAQGENFLVTLAGIFQVDVLAAVDVQGGAWVAGQHWNGPVVRATPSGGLSSAAWTPL